jgi:uncharacterized protein YhhL (DUF1145 family)
MNRLLKIGLLAFYALGLMSLVLPLPAGAGPVVQRLCLIVLAVHGVETALVLKALRRYPGPLAQSVGLSLLLGALHWWPLVRPNT